MIFAHCFHVECIPNEFGMIVLFIGYIFNVKNAYKIFFQGNFSLNFLRLSM